MLLPASLLAMFRIDRHTHHHRPLAAHRAEGPGKVGPNTRTSDDRPLRRDSCAAWPQSAQPSVPRRRIVVLEDQITERGRHPQRGTFEDVALQDIRRGPTTPVAVPSRVRCPVPAAAAGQAFAVPSPPRPPVRRLLSARRLRGDATSVTVTSDHLTQPRMRTNTEQTNRHGGLNCPSTLRSRTKASSR